MNPGCDARPADLLDHVYGLPDPTEAAAVAGHVATCPACAAALADARKSQSLFAAAAKGHFPNVTFAPPADAPTVPAVADERASVGRVLTRWAVAAGLLLAVTGLAIPTGLDAWDFFDRRPDVVASAGGVARARAQFADAAKAEEATKTAADTRLVAARQKHDGLVTAWVAEEKAALQAAADRPFAVEVRGPAAAVPGAPNEYAVRVRDKAGKPRPARLTAAVIVGDQQFDMPVPGEAADATVRLPAELWAKLPPGAEPLLQVSAQAGPDTATVRESVRLLGPVFNTFLTTDKPLYQPGETVYFRSTTLDRTRLLPPEQDFSLRFELAGPDGTVVEGVNGQARAVLAIDKKPVDVLGPDGRPVRGVGCGGFDLKPDAPGGTYTLSVFEVPPGQNRPKDGTRPLARRVVQVAGYRPDRVEKKLEFAGSSYGPGEPVQAKLTLTDQGKPVAGATVRAVAKADAQTPAVTADAVTAADGTATVRFALPGVEPAVATLSVTVETAGVTETIVRPVPLAGRRLKLEFFPEGGDLIAGLANRVYFRATTAAGRPADVAGVLHDGEREVCPVATLRDADRPGANRGLGLCTVTPQPGKTYTVKLSQPAGATGAFTLPATKPTGVVLHARDAATKTGEPIRVTLGHAGAKPQPVLVGAYTRGRAVAHARAVLQPGRTTDVTLDPGASPLGGVTRVTVFADDAGGDGRTDLTPLAERLVFRRPAEALKLTATPNKSHYLPGEPVTLTVQASTETGRPTAAVVWAAVVSRSVLSMADDTAERTLPTHFQLGGEVQQPDELEHADYLLTDQPQAAESLDLVLGTQGWRRFAEQAPEEFRTRVPAAEADRLLASIGASLPQFVRTEVQAVADRTWPKYEAAALALESAEKGRDAAGVAVETARVQAGQAYESTRQGFGRVLDDFDRIDGRLVSRRWWLVVTLPLLGLAVAGMAWRGRRATGAERRRLLVGAVGFVLVGLVLVAGSVATADRGAGWRTEAETITRQSRNGVANVVTPTPVPSTPPAGNEPLIPGDGVKGGGQPPRGLPPKLAPPKLPPAPPPAPVVDDGKPAASKLAARRMGPADRPVGNRQAVLRLETALNTRTDAEDREAVQAIRANEPKGRPLVIREYAHQPAGEAAGPRSDFAETVLWRPVVVLPDTGTAAFDFALSDAVTGYRVLVAGHTLDGRLGAVTETISVRPALSVEPKLPREVSTADRLTVPLVVSSVAARPLGVALTVSVNGRPAGGVTSPAIPADGGSRAMVVLPPLPAGPAEVSVTAAADGQRDSVRRTVLVVPDGFPTDGAKSESLHGKLTATVTLPGDRVAGGTRVGVTVYPNALAGVLGGLDGLLKEPHGCFEQSSSANYPNVLALDYQKATGGGSGQSRLLDAGYRKLAGFECPDTPTGTRKGFEWFGQADRPHPALSAYGLLQFADMSRVYPVDPALVARTKAYLLSLRTGDGGFRHSTAALDRFGRATELVTDAYVVWAVSEAERTGDKSDLDNELNALLKQTGDPYVAALVANAALNRGRAADGVKLLESLAAKQAADGGIPGAATTITGSGGDDRLTETTALAVLGWLKADKPDLFAGPVAKAVGFLVTKRQSGGAFGATQATVLALKVLVEHARRHTAEPESGELRLSVAGKVVATASVRTDASGPLTLDVPDADTLFPPGQPVELTAETTLKQAVPATLGWTARTVQPPTAADAPLTLAVTLDRTELAEGDTARLTATVTNTTDAVTGMAVAVVGLPAGLTVPADGKQLKQLVADGAVDFWEVRGRELVLYWRGLDPKTAKTVAVEVVAEFPGTFRGPASRAYLYYDAGRKHWLQPLAAVVVRSPTR